MSRQAMSHLENVLPGNVLSMKFGVYEYEMSVLWNIQSMKCTSYENGFYEISFPWNVFSMIYPFYFYFGEHCIFIRSCLHLLLLFWEALNILKSFQCFSLSFGGHCIFIRSCFHLHYILGTTVYFEKSSMFTIKF